jgi:signal transduction histidine kinase
MKLADLRPTFCDGSLIRQVWINLIGNAIKFSRKVQAPVVEINSFEKNGEIVYSIKDNGVGFEKENTHKLFQAFQRLHSKTAFEGSGIGLALVKRIVERHKGKVWAESQSGAIFYFSLPRLTS